MTHNYINAADTLPYIAVKFSIKVNVCCQAQGPLSRPGELLINSWISLRRQESGEV